MKLLVGPIMTHKLFGSNWTCSLGDDINFFVYQRTVPLPVGGVDRLSHTELVQLQVNWTFV